MKKHKTIPIWKVTLLLAISVGLIAVIYICGSYIILFK